LKDAGLGHRPSSSANRKSLIESGIIRESNLSALRTEANELIAILVRSVQTIKRRRK